MAAMQPCLPSLYDSNLHFNSSARLSSSHSFLVSSSSQLYRQIKLLTPTKVTFLDKYLYNFQSNSRIYARRLSNKSYRERESVFENKRNGRKLLFKLSSVNESGFYVCNSKPVRQELVETIENYEQETKHYIENQEVQINWLKFGPVEWPWKRILSGVFVFGACMLAIPTMAYAKGKKQGDAFPQTASAPAAVVTDLPSNEKGETMQSPAQKLRMDDEDITELLEEADSNIVPLLELYLKEHPEDIGARRALLKIHMQEGNFKAGLAILEQLIESEPERVEWRLIKAQAQEFTGNFEGAREDYQKILEKEPFSARALQGIASVMGKTGEDSLVLGMLEEAVEKASTAGLKLEATNLKLLLAQVHTMQGNVGGALEQYGALIKEDPEDFRPYLCQGLVYSLIGNKEKADENFQEFQKRAPPSFNDAANFDNLMLRAKAAARRLNDVKKRQEVAAKKGRRPMMGLEQPRFSPNFGSSQDEGPPQRKD